jgi:hypothetical protein
MNKKTGIVIAVVILLLLLLGGGVFLMTKKSQTPTTKTEQPAAQNTTPETAQGTLKSLLANGKSVKCSFDNSASDSAKSSGTVYVASGKMRGDFQVTSAETTTVSHMIVDSQNSYLWTDNSKQGFKFAVNQQEPTGTTSGTSGGSQGPDINQTVNYSCQDWSPDNSMFNLPSDITFSAFTVPTVPVVTGASTGNTSSQCAVCDNIPAGTARDTCKAQLNCK